MLSVCLVCLSVCLHTMVLLMKQCTCGGYEHIHEFRDLLHKPHCTQCSLEEEGEEEERKVGEKSSKETHILFIQHLPDDVWIGGFQQLLNFSR